MGACDRPLEWKRLVTTGLFRAGGLFACLLIVWGQPATADPRRSPEIDRPQIQQAAAVIAAEASARRRKPTALREAAHLVETTRRVLRDLVHATRTGSGGAEATLLEATASQLDDLIRDQRRAGGGPKLAKGNRLAALELRCADLVAEVAMIVAESNPAARQRRASALLKKYERPAPRYSGPTSSLKLTPQAP